MKIVNLCISSSAYTDGWSYQDNLLTKYQQRLGHEVTIITSQWMIDNKGNFVMGKSGTYMNENNFRVYRLKILFNFKSTARLKRYIGLINILEKEKPDILFIHGCQFIDMNKVVKYIKKHQAIKVFVDNHADFSNSASNWLSKNILHGIIWRHCAKIIEPYTTKFYGVLPARVDFLIDLYKMPRDKVDLLVMGADDEKVIAAKNDLLREAIREKYGVKPQDFLIMTGGKIDSAKKQTLLLMQAVKKINRDNVKLIVFGSVTEELKSELFDLCDGTFIQYIGWITADESYNCFASSDLAVFPGRHSVFWEQVAGLGIPIIVKYWEGTTHINVGGNCEFLYEDSVDEISDKVLSIIDDPLKYKEMKEMAIKKGMDVFSYKSIAERSIIG